ncbi:hypothetical protein Tco_1350535 [Tanacetum coccineum]
MSLPPLIPNFKDPANRVPVLRPHTRAFRVPCDFGLSKVLENSIRTNYAALWKALVLAGVNGIKENCLKSGAGNASDHSELQVCLLFLHKTTQGNAMDPAVDDLLIFNVFDVSLIMI